MSRAFKFLLAVLAVPMMLAGIKIMFDPMSMVDRLAVEPLGALGLNSMRGLMGGLMLASGGMVVMGFVRRNTEWFLAFAFVMAVVSVGRIVGLAADGVDSASVRPLVIELLLVALAVLAHRGAASQDG